MAIQLVSDSQIRLKAERLGLVARKVRDDGYGNSGWWIIDPEHGGVVGARFRGGCSFAFDDYDAAHWLTDYARP